MMIKPFKSNFDHWSWSHFFLGYFIVACTWKWIGVEGATVLAFLAIVINELIDVFVYLGILPQSKYFDKRGASWGDLLLGFMGIGVWHLQFGI